MIATQLMYGMCSKLFSHFPFWEFMSFQIHMY